MARVSINTYYKTALDLHQSGKLREARKLYADILKLKPDHLESLFMTGQSWYQEEQFEKALDFFKKGLEHQKTNLNFLLQTGKTLIKLGNFEEARSLFEELVNTNPNNPQVLFHASRNLKELGQFESAIRLYKQLINLVPNHMQAINNLGNLYQQIYDYDKSMECYDQLIELDSHFPMAYSNKAGLLQKKGELEEAEKLYHQTLQFDNTNALALYNLGVICNRRFEHERALQWIQKSLNIAPNNPKYLSTYANTLYSLGKKQEAILLLQKLIQTGTKREEPYLKLARIYISEHEPNKVIKLLEPYVQLNPYCYEGMCFLGVVYDLTHEVEKAEAYLTKVDQHPEFALRANMILQLLYSKMGRMDKYEEMLSKVTTLLEEFIESDRLDDDIPIYNLAYYPFDPELVTKATQKFSQNLIQGIEPLRKQLHFDYQPKEDRIKIGYLSPYFKNHPAGQLIQGVLKNHNREKFEIFGYAIDGGNDSVNEEIRSQVDHYKELGNLKMADAAKVINQDGIHILVSLAGYNYGMKSEIPALKPAPIQVICMDCHETIQTDFYDYMLKDEIVITDENRPFFSESIAFLPTSHFFNTEMIPSEKRVDRTDYELPEKAFVFGCLNHPRKLNPMAIRAWAKIVAKVPESVLWLYDAGISAYQKNVIKLFEEQGVDPSRIIFCGREKQKDHYRRMELIDLFLDTPIYNGHTTCLEALWASVPVLTMKGKSVSSRLCSSFLEALDIPEMICENMDDYVAKSIEVSHNSDAYKKVKNRFAKARETNAFFDPSQLTKKMEAAYFKMWDKFEKGEEPSDFKVA